MGIDWKLKNIFMNKSQAGLHFFKGQNKDLGFITQNNKDRMLF